VALPELGIDGIKAKVDTGARTSALHAVRIERFSREGRTMVRFEAHPVQRETRTVVRTEAELLELRSVRSSTGDESRRPVIETAVRVLGREWPIELTLVSRDLMGFRMLLGRQAIRRRFVVDPARSFVGGKPGPEARSGTRGETRDPEAPGTRETP
jgi:hypothetical protein